MSHQSPIAGHGLPDEPSHVVNRDSGIYRPRPESPVDDKKPVRDADDHVMPANDATLNTKI